MQITGEKDLRDYFLGELDYLRTRASDFARDYPKIAAELALSQGKSADPHVEALLQSVAFMTGRIQYQLNQDAPEISSTLLNILYPHFEKPLPSMIIGKANVKPDGANFANGYTLQKNRIAYIETTGTASHQPVCKFRNGYETELWPLEITEAGEQPTNYYDFLSENRKVLSILRLKVTNLGNEAIHNYPLQKLRIYINADDHKAFPLYRLLTESLHSIALLTDSDTTPIFLSRQQLQFIGLQEQHAMLPYTKTSHPAYRILQEYFSFPEKHLFFEINGLQALSARQSFEILLLLESPIDKNLKISERNFLLNCLPMINLFPVHIDPVRLDHREYEYRLIPGQEQYRYCEIYSIEEMTATRPAGKARRLKYYFGLNAEEHETDIDPYYWTTRRELSPLKTLPGTETYVAFHDSQFNIYRPIDDTISARVLCTNRNLPEKLRAGDRLYLEGVGPVIHIELITKPTRHESPPMSGMKAWQLISHLNLNFLSLSSNQESLAALKSILTLYASHSSPVNRRQIDSVCNLECRSIIRRTGQDAWRGFCRGIEVRLNIDESQFEGGSPLLFGEVLSHFFALYTSINSFTQLVLESKQKKGVWRTWQPMAGEQVIL